MSRSRLNLLVIPAFAASVVGVILLVRSCGQVPSEVPESSTATAPSASSGPVASAPVPLLEGLRVGDTVDEWTVSRMLVNESVEKKPQLAVELERKGSGITVWIARKGNAKNPPLSTEKYALTFGHPRLYGDPIPEGSETKVMNLLAERVRRTEATVETPAGL